MSTALKTASVLAFERNFDISDAYFSQTSSADAQESDVLIREKSVRGTISNRLKKAIASDPVKLDAEVEKANLQTVDVATLDENNDILIARFSMKVQPFTALPSVCNDLDYREKLHATINSYLEETGFDELVHRYAVNIANARWLWRNRLGAERISVSVSNGKKSVTIEDAKAISLNDFSARDDAIATIANWIKAGLEGKAFTLLKIEARATMGAGQEVFPSQELILDAGTSKKSKVLYSIDAKAGMHSQKIGNAIRTIDNWYPDAEFPIAVEPYGAVTTLGTAFRQPKQKNDFYNLFDSWVLKDETPTLNDQHYVVAVLLRGGVFGDSGKE